jgi:hypothetical protein
MFLISSFDFIMQVIVFYSEMAFEPMLYFHSSLLIQKPFTLSIFTCRYTELAKIFFVLPAAKWGYSFDFFISPLHLSVLLGKYAQLAKKVCSHYLIIFSSTCCFLNYF